MQDLSISSSYKVYKKRWLTITLLIPIIVASEVFWLTFAAVDKASISFFFNIPLSQITTDIYNSYMPYIDLFSLSYMLMYIVFTMPASYVIEKFGYKTSVIIGTVLTVVFGATRFFFSGNYILAVISQFLLAAGQPFLVNISTKAPANWFPEKERSTASGLLVMAQYLGMIIAMIVSTVMINTEDIKGSMNSILGVYALFALLCAIPVFFAKEKPPVAPGPEAPKESMDLGSIGRLFRNKSFVYVLLISFIAMGLYNTLLTKVGIIFTPRGADAGIIGAIFVICGVVGAVVLPVISDKKRSRVPFFIIGVSLMLVLIAAITFLSGFVTMAVISVILGFVIMGMAPILFQHGAEVAYPVQEGASFGLIMLMGQISGILFVVLFDLINGSTGNILWAMFFLMVFALIQIPISTRMKESALLIESRKK